MPRSATSFLFLLFLAVAFAAPAGSLIEAQASATYLDASNQSRTTTSNMVVTVVQQVHGVAVTPLGTLASPGQSRNGLAGSSVDLAYTVRNSGNGSDTFTLTSAIDAVDMAPATVIVSDANCNGRRDAGESVSATLTLAADASACVVVSATLPADAVAGDAALVALQAVSQADAGAAISDTWGRVEVSNTAVLTSFLLATPAGPVAAGATIDLVLSGTNVGAFDAFAVADPIGTGVDGILIAATVPVGLELRSATFAAGAGNGQLVYFDGADWSSTAGATPVGVGLFLTGVGGFFVQGADYELRYSLGVPGDAALPTQAGDPLAGDSYLSTGRVVYATAAGGATETAQSNGVQHVVQSAYHSLVGPLGLVTGDYQYDGWTITRSADAQAIAGAFAGNRVAFRNTVRNVGNAADSFGLALTGAPAGWSCGVYAADGATPVSVVGPVAPLASTNVVVRCQIPASGVTTDPSSVTVSAASVSRPAALDTTVNTVGQVASGYAVTFGGGGLTVAGEAGGTASFPLRVSNQGNNPDSFALSTVLNDLGPESTVTFYPGCPPVAGAASISSTGIVEAGAEVCVTAVVSIPGSATSSEEAGANRAVTFRAASAGDAAVSGEITHAVDVDHRSGVSFGPNRAGTVTSPGVIDLSHLLRNTGNTTADASLPAVTGVCAGCSVQYSVAGGAFATTVSGLELLPAEAIEIVMRLTVPSGEPIGRSLSVSSVATLDYGAAGSTAATVTDNVDVIGGELRLRLEAVTCADEDCLVELDGAATAAHPGDYVVYDITADNLGTAPLRQVVITDPLPPFTDFVAVSASASFAGTVLYSTDGANWSALPITALQTGQSVYVAVDRDADGGIGATDTLPVAGRVSVRLVTQVE